MTLEQAEDLARRAYFGTLPAWIGRESLRRARRIMAGRARYTGSGRLVIRQSRANTLNHEQLAA